jgi:hypothetical protein
MRVAGADIGVGHGVRCGIGLTNKKSMKNLFGYFCYFTGLNGQIWIIISVNN